MSSRSHGGGGGADDDDDDEVDAFGRVIPRHRSRSRSRSRSPTPDNGESDLRRRRYADESPERRRRGRRGSRSRSPDHRGGAGGGRGARDDNRAKDAGREHDAGRDRDRDRDRLRLADRGRAGGIRGGGDWGRPHPGYDRRRTMDDRPLYPPVPPPLLPSWAAHRQSYPPPPPPPHLAFHPPPPLLPIPHIGFSPPSAPSSAVSSPASASNAEKRRCFDARKEEEWMRDQYGYKGGEAAEAERLKAKEARRRHFVQDAADSDNSRHLHLLDDIVAASPPASSASSCVDNTLVINSIPPRVSRSAVLALLSPLPGFRLLSLSSATQRNSAHRMGYAVFASPAAAASAIAVVAGRRIDSWELRARGSVREVGRKDVAAASRQLERLLQDIDRARALIARLDEEAGWQRSDLETELPVPEETEAAEDGLQGEEAKEGGRLRASLRRLNLLISYLRWVHCYCFYCAVEYRDVEHLFVSCGMRHRRREKEQDADAAELSELARRVEERIAGAGGRRATDERAMAALTTEMLHRHVEMKSEGRHRCALCGKLFMSEEFVLKHLSNRHADEVQKAEAKAAEDWMWRRYAEDKAAPLEDSKTAAAAAGGGGAAGAAGAMSVGNAVQHIGFIRQPGQPLSPLTTMPFVPGLHNMEGGGGGAAVMMDIAPPPPSPAPVFSLPPISITPSSLLPVPAVPPAKQRAITSYADLDTPDLLPALPSQGLLLTPADRAAVHYGSVKGKWQPKARKSTTSAQQPESAAVAEETEQKQNSQPDSAEKKEQQPVMIDA